jgi:hypothetical protein
MSKVCENFELKLVEWAAALRDYDAAHKAMRASGWAQRECDRLDAIGRRLDRLRGPMHTALDRLAKEVG